MHVNPNPARPAALTARLRLVFLITVLAGAAADLASKSWIFKSQRFSHDSEVVLVPRVLSIHRTENPGAVWGILPDRRYLLTLFSMAAVGFMLYLLYRDPSTPVLFQLTLGLIVAGALGNLWDRLVLHRVRDFILVYIGSYRWPTFNLADAWICVGVGLFVLQEFFGGQAAGAATSAKRPAS